MFASRVVNPPSLGRLEPVPADRGGGGGTLVRGCLTLSDYRIGVFVPGSGKSKPQWLLRQSEQILNKSA